MRAVLDALPPDGATVAELTDAIYGTHEDRVDRDTHRGAIRRAAYALKRRREVELEVLPFLTYPLEGTGDPRPYRNHRPAHSLLVRRPTRARAWSPTEAAETLWRLRLHGGRARYEPNLSVAGASDPWPVSDHTVVRLEAWAATTNDASMLATESVLADLPGAHAHGTTSDEKGHRPYAWVLLDGDGSYCAHRREGWHRK
jgi:hypothetical protein